MDPVTIGLGIAGALAVGAVLGFWVAKHENTVVKDLKKVEDFVETAAAKVEAEVQNQLGVVEKAIRNKIAEGVKPAAPAPVAAKIDPVLTVPGPTTAQETAGGAAGAVA